MPQFIPIETLFYILGDVDFTVESDGAIRICYSNERDGDVDLQIPGDVGFLLQTLFRLPGVRPLINREELNRQRARHQQEAANQRIQPKQRRKAA